MAIPASIHQPFSLIDMECRALSEPLLHCPTITSQLTRRHCMRLEVATETSERPVSTRPGSASTLMDDYYVLLTYNRDNISSLQRCNLRVTCISAVHDGALIFRVL